MVEREKLTCPDHRAIRRERPLCTPSHRRPTGTWLTKSGRDVIDGIKKFQTFSLYAGQSVVLFHHKIYVMQQPAHERLFHDVDIVALAVETDDRHSFCHFINSFSIPQSPALRLYRCVLDRLADVKLFSFISRVLTHSLSHFKYTLYSFISIDSALLAMAFSR